MLVSTLTRHGGPDGDSDCLERRQWRSRRGYLSEKEILIIALRLFPCFRTLALLPPTGNESRFRIAVSERGGSADGHRQGELVFARQVSLHRFFAIKSFLPITPEPLQIVFLTSTC